MGSINCQVILLTKHDLLRGCHAWPSPEGKGSKYVKKKKRMESKQVFEGGAVRHVLRRVVAARLKLTVCHGYRFTIRSKRMQVAS
ncbi:hypothetical protein IscW_ISCW012921 [Ixodes scapularis]|uniref:Uncharacterized protein n=1 Tax=Ixodes scapularis TaxID=6945 RepID=B7QCA8_IXOSC|nr:hypothetical protein IscW_ISCW012921 [Ixodes scapularis]|eukprot:XP_002413172.1 hypothetical protein IscW_ISCW012921 [Ixodes scapularis]